MLKANLPPKISPTKRAFEKYKPRFLFLEFYGIFTPVRCKGSFLFENYIVMRLEMYIFSSL